MIISRHSDEYTFHKTLLFPEITVELHLELKYLSTTLTLLDIVN